MAAPRWEIVRSIDGQFFARFIARNGRKICVTETYHRKRDAVRAIALVGGEVIKVRVLTDRPLPVSQMPVALMATGLAEDVEVRDLT